VRYEEWEVGVPSQIRNEGMWKFFGYRKALFLYDVCWKDCETLLKHPLGKAVARQLIRSAGSISANLEEGYGRGYGKDRLYFLRIAIGSARESKGWYYRAKELLSPEVIEHRLNLIGEVIALLVTEVSKSANQQISKSSKQ
jgi:four helix bundle protein